MGNGAWFANNLETKRPGCVRATSVGFMGPEPPREGEFPTYKEVCTGRTGHVEVVQIVYDTTKCSYEELNEHLYTFHDPTTKNRQGNDHGPQYASVVFAHDESQRKTAEKVKAKVQRALDAGEITDYAGAKVHTAPSRTPRCSSPRTKTTSVTWRNVRGGTATTGGGSAGRASNSVGCDASRVTHRERIFIEFRASTGSPARAPRTGCPRTSSSPSPPRA